jgi:hypothetical protein
MENYNYFFVREQTGLSASKLSSLHLHTLEIIKFIDPLG